MTKETLAQPAQEPVAQREPDVVMHCDSHTWTINNPPPKGSGDVNLYYAPAARPAQPAQPAQPPQRTWVDLTRRQIQNVYFAVLEEHRGGHQMEGQLAFGEALQAAIKDKNK